MPTDLAEHEAKVLLAIEPDYDVMVLVVPSRAGVNDFVAADALASLKKRKLIAFEGRGKFKSAYLTDEGKAAYALHSDRAQAVAPKDESSGDVSGVNET